MVKLQEMKKQNLLEKQIHMRNLISRTKFHEKQRNFHSSENDNNEENQLIVIETNIANNNN